MNRPYRNGSVWSIGFIRMKPGMDSAYPNYVATARLETDNWTGRKFTDMFTLLKTDGEWKIVSKVFYLHPES